MKTLFIILLTMTPNLFNTGKVKNNEPKTPHCIESQSLDGKEVCVIVSYNGRNYSLIE